MYNNDTYVQNRENSLLNLVLFQFLPYWPLFLLLSAVCGAGAWTYLQYATPVYEISATLMLKDKTKGVEDSKVADFLNIYSSKKVVENEIEVIHSRAIMKEVVNNLYLYAPVWEAASHKAIAAYTSSPVIVELKDPDHIIANKKIDFSYTPGDRVLVGKESYVLNRWVNTPYGVLRFLPNANKNKAATHPLYFSLQQPKEVVDALLKKLAVNEVSKLATVVSLTFKDEVPERGENILNEITTAYSRSVANDKNSLASNTLAFVDARLKVVSGTLDSIERTIQQYKAQNGAVDVSEQGKLFLENISDNDRKLAEINSQLSVLGQVESYVVSKNSGNGIVPATLGIDDPVLKQLLQRLAESELKYEGLSQTVPENNQVLVSLAKEIEQIRPRILENIRNQQTSLQASKSSMSAAGNKFSAVLQSLPSKERKLLEISRQQSIESNVYAYLLQKREELALSNAATVTENRIIDRGESSFKPVSPKKWMIYLVALACAFIGGIVVVKGKELLGGKILFRSDIEHYTKIPVAAEIASIDQPRALIIDQPETAFVAEQFRQLGASLGLYSKVHTAKKLMITSGIAGEGKSFVAANLAMSLAGAGKKVALLDLDLRNPGSSSLFGLKREKGMSEYLNGEASVEKILKRTEYNNLYVIPAGKVAANSMELLLKGDLHALFASLETSFDYLLIDTSPVDPVTDAYVIAEYCDKILLVIRHDFTPKTMIQLLDANARIKSMQNVSIVFNGVKKRGFIKGRYGYGYGFGYEYVYKERVTK